MVSWVFIGGILSCSLLRLSPSPNYWLNWKNCWVPVMGLVTVNCPLATTGAGELVAQTAGDAKFVVDSRVYPASLNPA
jgi:hypothetical protein